MKKILVLFKKSDWKKDYIPDEKYRFSYEYFYNKCAEKGIEIYRASFGWYDFRKKIFRHAWKFNIDNQNWERVADIVPDLIFDKVKHNAESYSKTELINSKYKFFNSLEFTKIIDNKIVTSMLFSEWSKKCIVINSQEELKASLEQIQTEMAVLKPTNESGGNGVIIGKKEEILNVVGRNKKMLNNFILQEFIDSSAGIPGITIGIHDLRLVLINKKIVYSYIRKPAKGSYLANLAQGGTKDIIDIRKLPRSLDEIVKRAHDIFSSFKSKIYTIDVMFDQSERPFVIELNSMPGAHFEAGQESARKFFYDNLLEVFLDELN